MHVHIQLPAMVPLKLQHKLDIRAPHQRRLGIVSIHNPLYESADNRWNTKKVSIFLSTFDRLTKKQSRERLLFPLKRIKVNVLCPQFGLFFINFISENLRGNRSVTQK